MKIEMPIKVISEANQYEHWTLKYHRRRAQQKEFSVLWRNAVKQPIKTPCRVIWTRYASRLLDTDNLAGAFKFVRDQFAKEIGVDDGDNGLEFIYKQVKLPTREYYISIEITEK